MTAPAQSAEPRGVPTTLGDYTVVGALATGGMAELFLARKVGPEGFARTVVIKRILPHLAENDSFVTMFLDEARIAAQISHPNVVTVEELGRENDSLYMVMEYLAGESVGGLLRQLSRRDRLLESEVAAHIIAEAARGLHAAHELEDDQGRTVNVVHRDISPQNLFVTYDGTVKVLDFGIAKAADRLTRTESGFVKGKFEYMSPEQLQNQPLDRRADIFALGVVLYELLTGRRLFRRDSPGATVRAVMQHRISPPSKLRLGISPELDAICLRALARPIDQRYQSASELRRDLLRHTHLPKALPEERLRDLMHETFAERAAEKAEMIRKVSAGEHIDRVVSSPPDQGASGELPRVQSSTTAIESQAGARPKAGLVATAIAIVVAVAAGVAVVLMRDESAVSTPTALAPPRDVRISLSSDPPGATVRGPNGSLATTPARIALPRSEEPMTLEFELDGYESWSETVTPDTDQRIRVRLVASPAEDPAEAPEESTEVGEPIEPEVAMEEAAPPRPPARRRTRGMRGEASSMATMSDDPFQIW